MNNAKAFFKKLFLKAVASCQPANALPDYLPKGAPKGRNIVLGAGKAAAQMAEVANQILEGETIGFVVTRYGFAGGANTGCIEVFEAGHPYPDENSVVAAEKMLEFANSVGPDDRVIFLISGGGSALLCAPIDGVSFEQKREITEALLHSGATISEINLVRKQLSKIKGGGLAQAVIDACENAEMHTYAISDVVGDNPADIASGPTVASNQNIDQAIEILDRYQIDARSNGLIDAMQSAPGKPVVEHPVHLVATADKALSVVEQELSAQGWQVINLGGGVEGEAAEIGREHAAKALRYFMELKENASSEKVALISGGELTVTISNPEGRGGPNLEYLTGLMIGLSGAEGVEAIACDSDGVDGSEDNAGAYLGSDSLSRAANLGIDPEEILAENNSYELFSALDDLVVTGSLGTNVNDIRIILINPSH